MSHPILDISDLSEEKGSISAPVTGVFMLDIPIPPGGFAVATDQMPHHSILTIVEQITYVSPGEQPVNSEYRQSIIVESDEQPYSRKTKASDHWQKLDFGWIEPDKCSLLVITVLGTQRQTIPTPEEAQADKQRTLELTFSHEDREVACFHESALAIPPGSSIRITPSGKQHIWVRCGLEGSKAEYRYTVYPK